MFGFAFQKDMSNPHVLLSVHLFPTHEKVIQSPSLFTSSKDYPVFSKASAFARLANGEAKRSHLAYHSQGEVQFRMATRGDRTARGESRGEAP